MHLLKWGLRCPTYESVLLRSPSRALDIGRPLAVSFRLWSDADLLKRKLNFFLPGRALAVPGVRRLALLGLGVCEDIHDMREATILLLDGITLPPPRSSIEPRPLWAPGGTVVTFWLSLYTGRPGGSTLDLPPLGGRSEQPAACKHPACTKLVMQGYFLAFVEALSRIVYYYFNS